MTNRSIIRAWKDESYRLSLTEAERALLPAHPAGRIELSDAALADAAGGTGYTYFCTLTGCWTRPTHLITCYSGVCVCLA